MISATPIALSLSCARRRTEADGLIGSRFCPLGSSRNLALCRLLPASRPEFLLFYTLAMVSGVRYVPPLTRSAQIVRAILLANAAAATLAEAREIIAGFHLMIRSSA